MIAVRSFSFDHHGATPSESTIAPPNLAEGAPRPTGMARPTLRAMRGCLHEGDRAMDKIGIGFIGSRFAADLHAHALSTLRGRKCEFVAVCSKTLASAEAFAAKFRIPHVYTDPGGLLERKDIQLVTLPVVTSLHHTLAIQAANAGKHIIMEKPLTGCFAEAKTLPRQAMFDEAMRNADAVARLGIVIVWS
jgi:hypothetical protein